MVMASIQYCHVNILCSIYAILGKMDKYRLVEEKFIGAQGFIDDSKMTGDARPHSELGAEYVVRITQQAKPRRCITTAMNMLVSWSLCFDVACELLYDTCYSSHCSIC